MLKNLTRSDKFIIKLSQLPQADSDDEDESAELVILKNLIVEARSVTAEKEHEELVNSKHPYTGRTV